MVLNAVNYAIVQQMSLSSTEYPKGVDEFAKSGLTPEPSVKVRPPRVKESPLHFECKVREIIETGGKAGSANLVVCEILYVHVDESILDPNGIIDPVKLDIVGRMGGNYYVRAAGDALFEVPKPLASKGIGVDSLPESIRLSEVLTGNDLGQLGNVEKLPSDEEVRDFVAGMNMKKLRSDVKATHKRAKELIAMGRVDDALKFLMSVE